MFLEGTNTQRTDDEFVVAADETVNYLGEDFELIELVSEHAQDVFNLTVSMLRLEHRAIVTENKELLAEGVAAYWQKAVAGIKSYWAKFVAWLNKAVDYVVMKVYGPRKTWLEAQKAKGAFNVGRDSIKADLPEKLLTSNFSGMVDDAEAAIEAIAKSAGTVMDKAAIDSLQAQTVKGLGGSDGDSVAQAVAMKWLGKETTEVALNSATLGKLVKVAEDTFANGPKLKGFAKIASLTVKIAEQKVAVANSGDDAKAQAALRAVQAIGPICTQTVTGVRSANDRANAAAMSALTKAAHAKAENKAVATVKEDGTASILDQFGL